jgi:peptide chain release factor subunit 1
MASVSGAVDLPALLRRLAGVRAEQPQVLSLYLDLDPFEVPTAPARATAINALLDEAAKVIDEREEELDHAGKIALREDLATLRQRFEAGEFRLDGGKAFAIFRCSPLGLDEALPMPRSVPSRVVIDSAPYIEPLIATTDSRRWCVALINRRVARFLHGTRDRLEELARRRDPVHGKHDEGGWSQANYQRSIEADVQHHLQSSADELRQIAAEAPFDQLILGAPHELQGAASARFPSDLRDRLVGSVDVDVENTTPTQVLEAVTPTIEAFERDEERRVLDRLVERVARGERGAAGLEPTLEALNERRVEILAFEDGFRAPGRLCPRDGWLGPEGVERCPVDGGPTEPREDIVEDGVLAALGQSGDVLIVRHHQDLGPLGRIGAVLRF